MSEFLKKAIRGELEQLYHKCALLRGILQDQRQAYWGDGREWALKKIKGLKETSREIRSAEQGVKDHIREHAAIMGGEWENIPNRLCWNKFLGGQPIGVHYCNLPEGHEWHHQDDIGSWKGKEQHRAPKPPQRIKARREWQRKHNLPLP